MPSLVSLSDVSAIGDNVIPQLNAILKGTPLPPVRTLNDITPSLLLDLYELLFHIKLAYATPRDHSAESQLRNIRVLIGHIAHDILKMDLSFLEPQKICMRDERALADFLRIFLGVAKLRKAHLERGKSDDGGSPAKRPEEDVISIDGSEHTVRATPSRENTFGIKELNEKILVVRGVNTTPQKRVVIDRTLSAHSTPRSHSQITSSPLRSYRSSSHIEITKREISVRDGREVTRSPGIRRQTLQRPIPPKVPTAPPSDTSSIPSDFIHNVNERVSNIWNKLNSRANRQISDRISERPSSHSPRRPLSITFSDAGQLPAVPENGIDAVGQTASGPGELGMTGSGTPSLQEPTPFMKAWLDTAGADGSSHKPRSTQSTPQKPIPLPSTHTAPANFRTIENPFYSSPEDSPARPQYYTQRSKSSQNFLHSQRTPPKFALRRTMSEPKFIIDVEKAMFSNEPIRLHRQLAAAQAQEDSDSSDDDIDADEDESERPPSPTSSIATSALSVSSVEWTDTSSIAALRKKRLEALEEVKRAQEVVPEESYTPAKRRHGDQQGFAHSRRRSSIPSTFIHHRQGPMSAVSYETISPNSSASVAAERWKARWRADAEMGTRHPVADGSPVPRGKGRTYEAEYMNHEAVYEDDEYDEEYDEEEDNDVTKNTDDLEDELRGLDQIGLSESKRQIMLFERLIRRAVDKRPPGT
ncbi:hypothetical protein ABW19_dt0203799 [Dactylella cylindrospora]|nr:hypothetical protein ABW19_dt0203799 [Dactylella cylindrospora]